ncbi:MAG: hypothetical protein ACRCYY_05985, partial [Trueperaceae bacterium]
DHSNALVITQPKNGNVNVEVLRSTTSWHSLGSFTRPNQLQTNSSGQAHAVFQDKTTGTNTVKRWNNSFWNTIATFQKKACSDCSFNNNGEQL